MNALKHTLQYLNQEIFSLTWIFSKLHNRSCAGKPSVHKELWIDVPQANQTLVHFQL